jgi:hypothetical protein
VVFKLKQPPQVPRRRMTARAVANELGLSTDTVMAALADLNEYVQSPASKLEEPVIRRLYEALGGHYEPEKPKPPPEWQRQGRSHEVAAVVKSPGDRGALDQSSWHSRPRDDWWETRGDAAPAWEVASWKMLGFTEAERDAWIAHGLRPGQAKDAVAFRDAGLLPADLMEEVKGWTVLKRLRAGDQPEDIARLLRTSDEDQGTSAS